MAGLGIKKCEELLSKCTNRMSLFAQGILRKPVKVNLGIGTLSCTDHTQIMVQIEEEEAEKYGVEEILRVLKFKTGHEVQHILSTNPKEFERGIVEILKIWEDEAHSKGLKLSKHAIIMAKHIVNGIEDGRIERIMCSHSPGLKKYLLWYRTNEWKEFDCLKYAEDVPQLLIAINECHGLATRNLNNKGFSTRYGGTPIADKVKECKPLIKKAVSSLKCKDCMDRCIQIGEILKDVAVNDLAISETDTEMPKEIMDILEQIARDLCNKEENFKADSDEELNLNPNPPFVFNILTDDMDEDEDDSPKQEIGPDTKVITIDLRTKKDEEPESEDVSSEEESESSSSSSSSSEEESESSSSSSTSSEEESESSSSSSTSSEEEGESSSSSSTSSEEESESSSSSSTSSEKKSSNIEDALKKAMDDITEELEGETASEINREISAINREAKEEKENSEKDKENSTSLTDDEKAVLKDWYEGNEDSYSSYEEVKRVELNNISLPTDLLWQSKAFKRKVEDIFSNKIVESRRQQTSGRLDNRSLFKLTYGGADVFERQGIPSEFDGCCFCLMDFSASMSGTKQDLAARALAIAEEGLKEKMPVKMANFCVARLNSGEYGVEHKVMKDWEDNKPNFNYAWTYNRFNRASGGNKDGYSIRVATKELMKRSEKQKLLIVLSDGEPTDYKDYDWGYTDVNHSVKEARKQGVFVVSLYFGDKSFLECSRGNYEMMYEKDFIGCEPDKIGEELTKVLKKFVSAY